jgi:hypothetical protein
MTAAHRTLPFNTMVRVTNMSNGREVDVRINDRGPFIDGRVIDLSLRAAREIDLVRPGIAPVKLKILKSDQAEKPATFAVQVAAFENSQAAEDLKQQLDKKYSGVVIQAISDEKTLYRVRIRPAGYAGCQQDRIGIEESRFHAVCSAAELSEIRQPSPNSTTPFFSRSISRLASHPVLRRSV